MGEGEGNGFSGDREPLTPRDEAMLRHRGFDQDEIKTRRKMNRMIIESGGELDDRADTLIDTIRARNEGTRTEWDINVKDLESYFKAKSKDERAELEKYRYNGMRKVVIRAAGGDETKDHDQLEILAHIEKEKEKWIQIADETKEADLQQIAQDNAKIFAQFRNIFYGITNRPEDEKIDTGLDRPMSAEESARVMSELFPTAEEFPQYEDLREPENLKHTSSVLAEMEGGEIGYDHLAKFYTAVYQDISKSEEAYEDGAKWRTKREVVTNAVDFYKDHEQDPQLKTDYIYVSATPNPEDGSITYTSDWTPSPDATKDAVYVFDPRPGDDEKNLGRHYRNINKFDIWLKQNLPPSQTALRKMQRGEEISHQEFWSLAQSIREFGRLNPDVHDAMLEFIGEHARLEDSSKAKEGKKGEKTEGKKKKEGKKEKKKKKKD